MRTLSSTTRNAERVPTHRFARGHREVPERGKVSPVPSSSAFIIQRKASCACGGGCPACQAKFNDLKVSHPNDPAEIEANQIADKVMRMPKPILEEKCGPYAAEKELIILRKGPIHTSASSVPDNFVSFLGPGRPLDKTTRDYFEPRFGVDFSHVRVHDGQRAAQSASSINALAYTLGCNVVFGVGQYQPGTIQGKKLLAHELTHTIQQEDHKTLASYRLPNVTNESQSSTIQRQVRVSMNTTRCSDDQRRTIAEAIPGAGSMVWTALTWMISQNSRDRAVVNDRLRKNFLSDSEDTFDTVKTRLLSIHEKLTDAQNGRVPFDCAPATDSECADRRGYVVVADRSIHICPRFYSRSLEDRRWTLIHEFAHVVGALLTPEVYHAEFGAVPCNDPTSLPSSNAALANADNYARFVWCLTRRPGTVVTPP